MPQRIANDDEIPREEELDEGDISFIRQRRRRVVEYERDYREQAHDDLLFEAGYQWDETVENDRKRDFRPVLTFNHMPQFVRQVTGDIRINRPRIKVMPVDSGADPEKAELLTGLIRNIEQRSQGGSAYVTGAEGAVKCGQGHWRITTEYESHDSFDQDIWLRRIRDPLSVSWDPDAELETREDAKFCFVLKTMSKEEYKKAYPGRSVDDFDDETEQSWVQDWYDGDRVTIAEYWCKKPKRKTLVLLTDGSVRDTADMQPEEVAQLQAEGARFREVDSEEVVYYEVNGAEVLKGPIAWPGRYIPIVSVFGEETYIGDRAERRGLVRFLKDPQRVYNYDRSAAVEAISLAPKSPWLVTEEMIGDYRGEWDVANRANFPYLLYKPDGRAPGNKPERQRQAEVPVALIQDAQNAREDMHATSGIYPASLGQRSNESSGIAIRARENQGDVGTYVYADNLGMAIGYTGRQLIDLIPRIYDASRTVRILGEDDSDKPVDINKPQIAVDPETGEQVVDDATGELQIEVLNDLSVGKYDVIVSSGPSYSTKRQEAAESMTQFIQAAPDAAQIVMDLLAKNLDWPGADEIAERFRRQMVQSGIVDPDPEKGDQPPPPPPPDPKMVEAEAKVEKTQAETAKIAAETEAQHLQNIMSRVEVGITRGEIDQIVGDQALQILQQVGPLLQQPPETGVFL